MEFGKTLIPVSSEPLKMLTCLKDYVVTAELFNISVYLYIEKDSQSNLRKLGDSGQ